MLDACIIGAPRCGTSSLFQWLTAHPAIIGPNGQKELFFFMDEGHPLAKEPNVHTSSIDMYTFLFPDLEKGRTIEATTHYLFQDTARNHFTALESKPLVIAVLRDPAERVWSSFQYTRNNRAWMNPSLKFDQYVEWGLEGNYDSIQDHISHPGSAYVLSRDIKYGRYVEHLLPWRDAVGEERLLVMSFEKMVADPKATCLRIASTLEVDPEFYADFEFEAWNATYQILSRFLHSWARGIGKWIPENRAKRLAKRIYMAVATSEQSTKPKETEQAIQWLKEYYAPYNERLAEEFDIDISFWTQE